MSKLIELMLAAGVQWPVGAKWAVQQHRTIRYANSMPIRNRDRWESILAEPFTILSEPADDNDEAIISREEYQAAGGWMEWKGGECPVDERVRVELRHHAGHTTDTDSAPDYIWNDVTHPNRVVAYRVEPFTPLPTNTIYHGGELYRHAVILLQTEQTLVWRCDGAEYCCKPRQALIDPDDNGLAAAILTRLCGADVAPEHVREMREQMGWA